MVLSRVLDHVGIIPFLGANLCCLAHVNMRIQKAFKGLWEGDLWQPDLLGASLLSRLPCTPRVEAGCGRMRTCCDASDCGWWISYD